MRELGEREELQSLFNSILDYCAEHGIRKYEFEFIAECVLRKYDTRAVFEISPRGFDLE